MSLRIRLSLYMAVAAITIAVPLTAQGRSTATSAALDAAVASHPANDRAVVTSALSSSSAVAVAGSLGMSSDVVAARIAALDDATAQQLADRIRAGGSNVVISTTAIIIVLLILILLAH